MIAPSPLKAGIILARFLARTGLADLADALLTAHDRVPPFDQRDHLERLLVDHRLARRLAEGMKLKDADAITGLRQAVELLEATHGALAPSGAPPPATPSIAGTAVPAPSPVTLDLARRILACRGAVEAMAIVGGPGEPERLAVELALHLEAVIDHRLALAIEQLRASYAEKGQG